MHFFPKYYQMLAEKRKNIAWVLALSKITREVAVMVLNVSLITTHSTILG